MRVVGIIAEYNPLHNGHVYHLQQAKQAADATYCVVVMSGDFVQRGEPAIADKYIRAQWALAAGADLVLELPTVYALASAERFAYGGMRTLAHTGVLDALCFGSELPDIDSLKQAAHMLAYEPPAFREKLREQLSMGKSYPRARYDALQACGASKEVLHALREPNNILGVEYIRFLERFSPDAKPIAIGRVGGGYHEAALTGEFSSATAIREALLSGDIASARKCIPVYVGGGFGPGKLSPVSLPDTGQLVLYALRRLPVEALRELPDVREGLENVLHRAAIHSRTLDELFSSLKSKRYTMARCKRIAMCAMLGITNALLQDSLQENAGYLRVLGFRREARPLISKIGKTCTAPLIMRRADCEKLSAPAQNLLKLDIFAHDIHALIGRAQSVERDFAQPPIIL